VAKGAKAVAGGVKDLGGKVAGKLMGSKVAGLVGGAYLLSKAAGMMAEHEMSYAGRRKPPPPVAAEQGPTNLADAANFKAVRAKIADIDKAGPYAEAPVPFGHKIPYRPEPGKQHSIQMVRMFQSPSILKTDITGNLLWRCSRGIVGELAPTVGPAKKLRRLHPMFVLDEPLPAVHVHLVDASTGGVLWDAGYRMETPGVLPGDALPMGGSGSQLDFYKFCASPTDVMPRRFELRISRLPATGERATDFVGHAIFQAFRRDKTQPLPAWGTHEFL